MLALLIWVPACIGEGGDPTPRAGASTTPDSLGTVTIAPGEPIQIGTLLTASAGPDSETAADALRGVELALDFLDGTLDGETGTLLEHPVELVMADERCASEVGQAGGFDDIGDLLGVIGPGCAEAVIGQQGAALADAGVVMISPSATDAVLTDPAVRPPTFFRTAYNARVEGVAVADFVTGELDVTRGAVAYQDPSPTGPAASFRTAFEEGGGLVTLSGSVADDGAGAGRVLGEMAVGSSQAVYVQARRPVCADAARQADSLPTLQMAAVVVGAGCFDSAFLGETVGRDNSYVAGPDLTLMQQDDFYRVEFLAAYLDQFGTQPIGAFHAQAYDATLILLDAIDLIAASSEDGTITIGRAALRDAVEATSDVFGLSGILTCTETGDCVPDARIAIYKLPDVPLAGGSSDAEPVFSETVTLADVAP